MADGENTGDRFMRFHKLYGEVVRDEFDPLEFAEDDFYAFQVLDRAFRSDDQELRNLAAHLQTQREAALETITLRASEILENTRRMKTVELKILEQKGESGDLSPPAVPLPAEPDAAAARTPEAQPDQGGADAVPPDDPPAKRRKGWFR